MILGNIWRSRRPHHVYVVCWRAPQGWLYLGSRESWQLHPNMSQVYTTYVKAEQAASRGEGQVVDLGRYEPWSGATWLPDEAQSRLVIELDQVH